MFRVHSVSQRPNLRRLGEPLGGAESLLEAVSFKKATEGCCWCVITGSKMMKKEMYSPLDIILKAFPSLF